MRSLSSIAAVIAILSLLGFVDIALGAPKPKAPWIRKGRQRGHALKKRTSGTACASTQAVSIQAPKKNIWYGLTNDEAAAVTGWLFAQKNLNLTVTEDVTEWGNSIILVELMIPNKTDALKYIDGKYSTPKRYAHVVLDHRATTNPYYQDLLVGPLPVSNHTTKAVPLTYPYTKKNSGKVRNLDADTDTLYTEWLYKIGESIKDITMDLWGGMAIGAENDTLDIWGIDPLWQDDGRIIRWDTFWNYPTDDIDAETLLPMGLYFKSDVTGRDPSKWKQLGWLYNDIYYPTTKAFRKAYYSKGFKKNGGNVYGKWASSDQQGPVPAYDTMFPPITALPGGTRFAVDSKEKYVKWMDFEFYLAFSRDTGMKLFDIKYKGQRIIYELGLQEALAHYAGNDPMQSGTAYLDTYYGFGPYSFELIKGYDCPTYATYWNSSFYVEETTHTHIDSICMFETEAPYPMARHTTSKYASATKNIYFTLRNVCTVGNYDYVFSYEFYMDGSIDINVRASGYIQSAYFAHNGDYGYKIHDYLSGSMHDHVLNYKVDFDILGTKNTMQKTTPVPVTESYVWSTKPRNTMKLQRDWVTNEDNSKLNWGSNSATQFTIVNKEKTNKYGEYRGFRMLPSLGVSHLTVERSSNLENSGNFALYDFYVTKQKDTEPRSAHPFASQDVFSPPVDFNKFFNGENLVQEDLVVWFNLGMHHVPHTGDLPNTVTTTAHSGMHIAPVNYLLGDPSKETVNMVRIDYNAGVVSELHTFGQSATPLCSLSLSDGDLENYHGDSVIRKFPYDPNDWYYQTDSIV